MIKVISNEVRIKIFFNCVSTFVSLAMTPEKINESDKCLLLRNRNKYNQVEKLCKKRKGMLNVKLLK